ncbi:MAG: STAS domain-containing protein [Fretibacterium sp.]|nr:STAS domain-containing protein [Fretibacterium sp.]
MKEYSLNALMKNGKLCFNLAGRIDSTNSKDFGDVVTAERKKHPIGSIIFDCARLEYVSSAGLRVFLTLNNREENPIRVINVSQEVYDIFDITGFNQIFEVSKALRDVSNEKTQKIGYTGGITVYYIGDETLMKVYPEGMSLESIEQERKYAQVALVSGIPTLIAYDVVTYQGHYGMLYELVKANTVSALLETAPWKLETYAEKMGNLLKLIHSSAPKTVSLPNASDIYSNWARKMTPWLHGSEINVLLRLISVIPESNTIVYGNFHARNVFIQHGELILLNMAGICCGNPIYDLGTSYMIYMNEYGPFVKRMSGFDPIQAKKFWNAMMGAYFDAEDRNVIQAQEKTLRAAALLRSALYPASYSASHAAPLAKEDAEIFVSQARRYLFPAADHIEALLRSAKLTRNI